MISSRDVFLAFLKRCLPGLALLVVMAIGRHSSILGCVLVLAWFLWVLWREPRRRRAATIFGAVVGFLIGGGLYLSKAIPDSGSPNLFDAGLAPAVLGYLVGAIIDAAMDLRDLERSPLNGGEEQRS